MVQARGVRPAVTMPTTAVPPTAKVPEFDPEIIDADVLKGLIDAIGDVKPILEPFFVQVEEKLPVLREQLWVFPLHLVSPGGNHAHSVFFFFFFPRLVDREKRQLRELSETGHFLKGSSANLGIRKIREVCQKIQYFAKLKDVEGKELTEAEALALLPPLVESYVLVSFSRSYCVARFMPLFFLIFF